MRLHRNLRQSHWTDEAENEGQAEASIEAALRAKTQPVAQNGRRGGLACLVLAWLPRGVQWTANAWQTQDWVSLGGCVAGALIIGAGVGSVAHRMAQTVAFTPTRAGAR
ncbi:Uncharacterised protein [Kluyvera cryocrescens]|uniref:Uncharacterized protein n=1 Tax=Kluyvera cryocrescens TaxID=580 RepID=A0A485A2Y8_KLUCR|nr:Uncharacterised protein [Kluyvera cryocrescens]